MKPNLKLIRETHRPVVDIYAGWREQIASRDWERVHVAGDKRQPIELGDRKGGWR